MKEKLKTEDMKEYQKKYRLKNKTREKIRKAIWFAEKEIKRQVNVKHNKNKIKLLKRILYEVDEERGYE